MKKSTCCFTGHRKLSDSRTAQIIANLDGEIRRLSANGVTNFISGGALGFDQIAAELIIERRDEGECIRLIFALPCKDQDALWDSEQKRLYNHLIAKADEIIYVSDIYDSSCMKRRNHYIVEHSSVCLCALLHERSGTAQTVRLAHKKGLQVINVATDINTNPT